MHKNRNNNLIVANSVKPVSAFNFDGTCRELQVKIYNNDRSLCDLNPYYLSTLNPIVPDQIVTQTV